MLDFLSNPDNGLRKALLIQLRSLWTHTSTAIEGNTLSLGETAFILEEGFMISGKPLKDHQAVLGHARAVDLVHQCLPPIIIPREQRKTHIDVLSAYHHAVGQIRAKDELVRDFKGVKPFAKFCNTALKASMDFI